MHARWLNLEILVAATVLAGCSGDFADFDTSGTTAFGDGDSGEPPLADSTGGPDGTGEDTADEDGTGEAEACELDCGPGGECNDNDGAPVCVCETGYAAYGMRCLPCTATATTVELDIPRVEVTATFLLNGETFPASFYEHGLIALRDPATGDEIELGSTTDSGTESPVAVLPGNYEVHYRRLNGGSYVPANRSASLRTITIPDSGSFDLEVDVPAVEVAGTITINGAAPPSGFAENAALVLRDPRSGDEFELADTRDQEYRMMIIPGTYDLHYRERTGVNVVPINADVRIAAVEIYADEGDEQELDIDVPVTSLSGSFRIDGATPPMGSIENGRILLRDELTGDEFELGQTSEGDYAAPVVPGDYAVVYRRMLGGNVVPANRAAVLETLTLAPGDQTLDVDIATTVLTGVITIDGSPPPADPGDDGLVVLRNLATGDEAVLGNTADGTYSRRVILGDYELYYRQETSSGGVPVNTNARLDSVNITGGESLDVDIPMVTLSAEVTVSGEAPPDSAYDDGLLYLRNPDTGDSVLLGNTRMATLSRPVVPGTYELHYVVEAAGPTMPVNAESRLDTVEVGPTTELDVDIPVVDFHAVVTVDGLAPPMSTYERAALLLHDVDTHDEIYLGAIDNGELRLSVTAGTYVLAYRELISQGLMPINTNAGLACIELLAE